ncbi:MAG TPA: hypothetical protein VEK08_20395 [Planctomycetota bacterium]|nr:hypothetical protein [Planctomycetota bacterium]
MSDDLYIPGELLPRDRRYRPETQGFFIWLLIRCVWLGALWMVLAVLYAIFSRRVMLPWNGTEAWYVLCGAYFAFVLLRGMLRRIQAATSLQQIAEAQALLQSGETHKAATILENLCVTARMTPRAHALAVFERGRCFLLSGRADQALSLFFAAYSSGWLRSRKPGKAHLLSVLTSQIATCYAINNDLPNAEKWQGVAHDLAAPGSETALLLMDTLIGIRNGRFVVVARDAESALARGSVKFAPAEEKLLLVLSAFALSQANPNAVHDQKIAELVQRAQPVTIGQFDYLLAYWPELREFLAAHQMSAAPTATEAGKPVP